MKPVTDRNVVFNIIQCGIVWGIAAVDSRPWVRFVMVMVGVLASSALLATVIRYELQHRHEAQSLKDGEEWWP